MMIGALSLRALLLREASEFLLSWLRAPALTELWFLWSFLLFPLADFKGDLFTIFELKVLLYAFWAAGTLDNLLELFLSDLVDFSGLLTAGMPPRFSNGFSILTSLSLSTSPGQQSCLRFWSLNDYFEVENAV
jgi:hypothetical protein